MRLAIDVRSLMDRPTGIGVYGAQCVERLSDAGVELRAYSFGGQCPSTQLEGLLPRFERFVHHPVPTRAIRQIWRRGLGRPIERLVGDVDLVFATEVIVPPCRAPVLTVVHDALFLAHPEWFPRYVQQAGPEILEDALARAAVIVHSSHTTAADIAARYDIAGRAVVVPPSTPVHSRWRPGGKRALFVGTQEPRKGLGTLARAMARLPDDVEVDVVGKVGWGAWEGRRTAALLAAADRWHVRGFVSPKALERLRANAALVVAPSLAEGFGLPLLEGLAAGLPTVASDIDVFREVAGDGAALVPATDVDAWADALGALLSSTSACVTLSERGLARARAFSPEAQSQGLLAAVRRGAAA